jgi:hypothetical protein
VVDLGRICVKKTCIFCDFFVFFCKKRAFFVIFCHFFAFLVIFLTILCGFGVVVTGGVSNWTLGEMGKSRGQCSGVGGVGNRGQGSGTEGRLG